MKRFAFLLVLSLVLLGGGLYQGAVSGTLQSTLEKVGEKVSVPVAEAAINANAKSPTCLDNYESWPSSTTRKQNVNWDVGFIDTTGLNTAYATINNLGQDLNGDGLADYMYHKKSVASASPAICKTYYTQEESCVYLNNGHGWEKAFRCIAVCGTTGVKFYGDCAG